MHYNSGRVAPDSSRSETVELPNTIHGEVMVFQPTAVREISHSGMLVETAFPLQLDSLPDFRLTLGSKSIVVKGRGAHGARPQAAVDPVIACCHIGAALQTVVARNLPPGEMGVLSVTRIAAGDAYNVIPEQARLGGTVRAMKRETLGSIETAMKRVVTGVAEGLGAQAEVDYRLIFPPLVNAAEPTQVFADAAAGLVGEANVDRRKPPASASEDFAFMLERAPGAYINLGNGEAGAPVHNDRYDFNDEAIPYGASVFATLVERRLVPEPGPA